jgi:hypothetical protein
MAPEVWDFKICKKTAKMKTVTAKMKVVCELSGRGGWTSIST